MSGRTPAEELLAAADRFESLQANATQGRWRAETWTRTSGLVETWILAKDPVVVGQGLEVARGIADEDHPDGPWLTRPDAELIVAAVNVSKHLPVLLRKEGRRFLRDLPGDQVAEIDTDLWQMARNINGGDGVD